MNVKKRFLDQYLKEIDYYEKAAQICSDSCQNFLERSGLRAIVTYRVKRPDRLSEKLNKRQNRHHYNTVEAIYEDIVDLAGVRIALYFPGDLEAIDRFIKSHFQVKQIKTFPLANYNPLTETGYQRRFSGYHAAHYRVMLSPKNCSEHDIKYSNALIEIQVASVLMHAWAEVEHDLVYKPLSGALSTDEYEILDELNGLVLSGEIALKRLQKAVQDRVKRMSVAFENHYELASFLFDRICQKCINIDEVVMGRVDQLHKFLSLANLNSAEKLEPYIEVLSYDYQKETIVEHILDEILLEHPEYYGHLITAKIDGSKKNPYADELEEPETKHELVTFLESWFDHQTILRKYADGHLPKASVDKFKLDYDLIASHLSDPTLKESLNMVKAFRDQLVYQQMIIPPIDKINSMQHVLSSLIENTLSLLTEEERKEVLEELKGI